MIWPNLWGHYLHAQIPLTGYVVVGLIYGSASVGSASWSSHQGTLQLLQQYPQCTLTNTPTYSSQRGQGGAWALSVRSPVPPWSPPNKMTLCTRGCGEPPFWVPVSALFPSPQHPLAAPSFWKVWLHPWVSTQSLKELALPVSSESPKLS